MKRSKAEAAAQTKYDGQQRKVLIRFDRRTEADLIEKLESVTSMQAYIKDLIAKDIRNE